MAKKKEEKLEVVEEVLEAPKDLKQEEAVKLQTHCAKCGVLLNGYVENNYKRFCGPGCAS